MHPGVGCPWLSLAWEAHILHFQEFCELGSDVNGEYSHRRNRLTLQIEAVSSPSPESWLLSLHASVTELMRVHSLDGQQSQTPNPKIRSGERRAIHWQGAKPGDQQATT